MTYSYFDELKKAMTWLGMQKDVLFLGQAVGAKGTAMSGTLDAVPAEKKLELPVFEEAQLGMTTGLAMQGFCPVSVFPRWNFLILAMNQLVNHLDKLPDMGYYAKSIIRVGCGSVLPLHPQHQHVGDFTDAVRSMLKNVKVVRLDNPGEILGEYQQAYYRLTSTVLVEVSDFYDEDFRRNYGNFQACNGR